MEQSLRLSQVKQTEITVSAHQLPSKVDYTNPDSPESGVGREIFSKLLNPLEFPPTVIDQKIRQGTTEHDSAIQANTDEGRRVGVTWKL